MDRRLSILTLEDRSVPATFGIPWADPNISLSFAPDGTTIAGRMSNLFATLNQDDSPEKWQEQIIRAYYEWTRYANLNIAVVPDSGAAFGTPGRLQNDPRFGDIRIGGNRLGPDALAVTTPSDPGLAGTLAGDVFFNSRFRFNGQPYDLYRVSLHEAGHAFGLDHSSNPASPMYPRFNNSVGGLTAGDIAAIQALYGRRTNDRFEGRNGNSTFSSASAVPVPTGYTGATPLIAFADIATDSDVDTFWFDSVPAANGNDNITLRVRTSGLSVLGAKVSVYRQKPDGSISEVANITSDSADYMGDDLSVSFDGNDDDDPRARFFVRVERSTSAPFGTGRYAMSITFDGTNQTPIANVNSVLLGSYDRLSANDLARLLVDPNSTLVNRDFGSNETFDSATFLATSAVSRAIRRSEGIGSLETASDVDNYRIVTPALSGPIVLRANAWAITNGTARPQLTVRDANGVTVPSEVLINHDGTYAVQATGLAPSSIYIITVAGSSPNPTGNYLLTVDCSTIATTTQSLTDGTLPQEGSTRTDTLYIGQSQLFHFLLSADAVGVPAGARVTMVLRDMNGNILTTLTARAGETVSAPSVWLRPGEYRVSFTASGNGTAPLNFRLRGNRITDPVGPVVDDPTLAPSYTDPANPNQYQYPNLVITTAPFFWLIGLL